MKLCALGLVESNRDRASLLARLRLGPTRHVQATRARSKPLRIVPVATSYLPFAAPLREPGSSVKIDAAQDLQVKGGSAIA